MVRLTDPSLSVLGKTFDVAFFERKDFHLETSFERKGK